MDGGSSMLLCGVTAFSLATPHTPPEILTSTPANTTTATTAKQHQHQHQHQHQQQWVVFTPTERVFRLRPSRTRAPCPPGMSTPTLTGTTGHHRHRRQPRGRCRYEANEPPTGSRPPRTRWLSRSSSWRARVQRPRRSVWYCATRTASPRSRLSPVCPFLPCFQPMY